VGLSRQNAQRGHFELDLILPFYARILSVSDDIFYKKDGF